MRIPLFQLLLFMLYEKQSTCRLNIDDLQEFLNSFFILRISMLKYLSTIQISIHYDVPFSTNQWKN